MSSWLSSWSTTNSNTAEQLPRETDFLNAAKNGNLGEVKEYINTGVNKEAASNDGWTALHYAIWKGHLEIVTYLIETCHVDTEVKSNGGWTALHLVCRWGHLSNLEYLIETCHVNKEARDNAGRTALHWAIDNDHLVIAKFLIETCNVDKEAKDKNGWTALHYASTNGCLNIVKYLIGECHVDKETKDKYGWTAFHYARKQGCFDIVQYYNDDCYVNTNSTERWQQEKEFLDAAKNGNLDKVIEYIYSGINKEAKTSNGWTALHCASDNGHIDIVQHLVETCHVDTEAIDNYDWTALHIANYKGHLNIVQFLIERCHVDKEASDNDGRTALHIASYNGHLNIVQYLIGTCHVDKDAKDNYGWTALHYASKHGYLEIVKYLIEICRGDMEAKNGNGETAYDLARKNSKSGTELYLKKARADSATLTVHSMESKKVSATTNQYAMVDQENDTVASAREQRAFDQAHKGFDLEFIEAARKGNIDKVKECIENGIEVEATNKQGITALHIACSNGHMDIVRYLAQDCGINVEMKTNIGRTALHDACSSNNLDIVEYLMETCHVDVEARDNDGWTALHFASRYGCLDIVQYLIQQCHMNMDMKNNAGELAYDVARKDEIKELLSQGRADEVAVIHDLKKQHHSLLSEISTAVVKRQLPINVNSEPCVGEVFNAKSDHLDAMLVEHDFIVSELIVSLQSEMQSFVDKLSQLGDSHHYIDERRDVLDLLCVEKCNTIEEQNEQSAILASPVHRDFYLLLQRKLRCMIKSCETLSTGMVGVGGGDMRSFAARTIREKGCNVLRETKLGFFIGSAVQWAKQNLAVVPFIDTVGSVFQLIVALSEERDRYLGLARVADFATMVSLQQYGTTSLDNAVEKFARLIVRARCGSPSCKFVEEMDEFGKYKQLMINLLADSGNTPAKEQASKAADCAFAHIMKPGRDSLLFDVLYGDTFDVGLVEALAASILGIDLGDLRNLAVVSSLSELSLPNTSNATVNGPSSVRNAGISDAHISDGLQDPVDISKVISEQRKMQWDIENLKKNQKPPKPKPDTAWGLTYADVYEEHDIEDVKYILMHLRDKASETDRIILKHAEHTEDHSALLEFIWQNMSRKQKERFKHHQRNKRKQHHKEEQIRKKEEDELIVQRLQEGEKRKFWIRKTEVDDEAPFNI